MKLKPFQWSVAFQKPAFLTPELNVFLLASPLFPYEWKFGPLLLERALHRATIHTDVS